MALVAMFQRAGGGIDCKDGNRIRVLIGDEQESTAGVESHVAGRFAFATLMDEELELT